MRRAALLALLAGLLATAAPAQAVPGKIAIGLAGGVSPDEVVYRAWSATGGVVDRSLEPLGALVLTVPDREAALDSLRGLPGVTYVEPVKRSRSLAFEPNDPLVLFQWYLPAIHAFDFWDTKPELDPVLVAVIDSGIDASNPEFKGRIAGAKSFVKGKATLDAIGHGTMVAGEIGAAVDNGIGIAGVGFPVQLLVGKVVAPDGSISVEAEAKAIRWAVDSGAQVVNLSLGGRRDPQNPTRDLYSPLEQSAIDYAYENGAVVVAATGNCDSPCPWPYASYPAALPHVIGVSALSQSGKTPAFSNRDLVYNDIAAPGVGIVSTFPLALTDPKCAQPATNLCALPDYRIDAGTSFAAPLVSAAAALLLAERPNLTASQVMALLEHSADDVSIRGRDSLTGNGLLNVSSALSALALPAPPADRFEPNDDAGSSARTLYGTSLDATVDYFDDPSDVYRVHLKAGHEVRLSLTGPSGTKPTLVLWRPGTQHVTALTVLALRRGFVLAHRKAANPTIAYRVPRTGSYYVEVRAPEGGGGEYRLAIAK